MVYLFYALILIHSLKQKSRCLH